MEVATMGAPIAQGTRRARVTSSGVDKKDLKNYFRSYGRGDQISSFGNYTAKGVGETRSFGTSKAGLVPGDGAKVTQSYEAPKTVKTDPKWKAFTKQMVGVGGEVESV
jgi:hypothetical protein